MATSWDKIIIHADMDAFYAAVEQLDNPELRGKPVLVGGLGKRSVVSTASYEARIYGIHSAMPMSTARARCREAVVVPPRFSRYKEVSRQIMAVFGSMSPTVEPLSLDEAFLDMTGAERLLGPPREMAKQIKRKVREVTLGLTVSCGIATTKYVAKVASDFEKPDGLTLVEPGEEVAFLAPLGIKHLWGVGPKTLGQLEALGLKTIGDVARTDEGFLRRRLGALGSHISALSRGLDERGVEIEREAKSIGAERTLEEDIVGFAAVERELRPLAEKVGRMLRQKGCRAGGVRVKIKTSDFRLRTRQERLPQPTDATLEIENVARALLKGFELDVPIRLVGVAMYELSQGTAGEQVELFPDRDREKKRKLDRALDLLSEKFGEDIIKRGGAS